jgi:hypothetical protein
LLQSVLTRAVTCSASNIIAPHSFKPSTLRVRRYRERRREGLCCFTVEVSKAGIDDAIARGMLKPDYDMEWARRVVCRPFVGRRHWNGSSTIRSSHASSAMTQ